MSDFKRRYRAIRNATYDPDLASRAAYWSDENIFNRLGIKVPKSVPKLRPMPKVGTTKRKRLESAAKRRLEKFNKAKLQGLTPERAYRFRYRRFAEVEAISELPDVLDTPYEIPKYTPETDIGGRRGDLKAQRQSNWSHWSKKGNDYPLAIKELVGEVAAIAGALDENLYSGLDENSRYAWAMVYYAYIDQKPIGEVMAQYVVDPFDGDKYVEVLKT